MAISACRDLDWPMSSAINGHHDRCSTETGTYNHTALTLFFLHETIPTLTSRYDRKSFDFVPRTKWKCPFADTEEARVLSAGDTQTQYRALAVSKTQTGRAVGIAKPCSRSIAEPSDSTENDQEPATAVAWPDYSLPYIGFAWLARPPNHG